MNIQQILDNSQKQNEILATIHIQVRILVETLLGNMEMRPEEEVKQVEPLGLIGLLDKKQQVGFLISTKTLFELDKLLKAIPAEAVNNSLPPRRASDSAIDAELGKAFSSDAASSSLGYETDRARGVNRIGKATGDQV